MNLFGLPKTNQSITRKREGQLSQADASIAQERSGRRLSPTGIAWAASCVVAMLGWTSALVWFLWNVLRALSG